MHAWNTNQDRYWYEFFIKESKKHWVAALTDCGEEIVFLVERHLKLQEQLQARLDWGVKAPALYMDALYTEPDFTEGVEAYNKGNFYLAGQKFGDKDSVSYVELKPDNYRDD